MGCWVKISFPITRVFRTRSHQASFHWAGLFTEPFRSQHNTCSYKSLAQTQSYDYSSMQERLGNVVFKPCFWIKIRVLILRKRLLLNCPSFVLFCFFLPLISSCYTDIRSGYIFLFLTSLWHDFVLHVLVFQSETGRSFKSVAALNYISSLGVFLKWNKKMGFHAFFFLRSYQILIVSFSYLCKLIHAEHVILRWNGILRLKTWVHWLRTAEVVYK